MMNDRLLLHLLIAMIFLVLAIYSGAVFINKRTKYKMGRLIIYTVLFISTILSYFHPQALIPGLRIEVKILISVIVVLLFFLFMLYPHIKVFLSRQKTKNK